MLLLPLLLPASACSALLHYYHQTTLTHLYAITEPRQCLCYYPVSPASEGGEHAGAVNLQQGL
jgi:hypothetical protein